MKYLLIAAVMSSLASGSGSLRADTLTGQVSVNGAKDNADSVVFIENVPGQAFDAPARRIPMGGLNRKGVPT